jgi:hypothetical protein
VSVDLGQISYPDLAESKKCVDVWTLERTRNKQVMSFRDYRNLMARLIASTKSTLVDVVLARRHFDIAPT